GRRGFAQLAQDAVLDPVRIPPFMSYSGASPPSPLHALSRAAPAGALRSRGSLAALVRVTQSQSTAAGFAQFAQDAVLDPVRIPPFNGIYHLAVDQHREVQVIAAGHPGHPALAELLLFLDHVPGLDGDRREVSVERLDAHPVIDDDAVAVDAERRRVHDPSAVRRHDR